MGDDRMSEEREQSASAPTATPRWVGIAVILLAAISIGALGVGWNAVNRAEEGKVNSQGLVAQVEKLNQTVDLLNKRLAKTEEVNTNLEGDLSVVTDRLKITQGELARARKQASQIRDEYAKQLAQVESEVKGELATKASSEAVQSLSGDVSGVRSDLELAKQNLQFARGELGTLIARNREEIDQLRRLGLRDYYEFTLDRKGSRAKLGDILIELRGTNTKRNQFTVALHVDDLRLEKKNRSINEPIYFYTRGSRAPLELVVNQVGKNKVVGYMSVPKGNAATPASGN